MNTLTYEEFMKTEAYSSFIKENSEMGQLKVMAFTAHQGLPIENAEVVITKNIDTNRILFFRGFTNSSGIIDNINLPAPPSGYNSQTEEINNYTIYDLYVTHPEYEPFQHIVGMFGDLKVIQYAKLIPNIQMGGNRKWR